MSTTEQRMQALRNANKVRFRQAEYHRQVARLSTVDGLRKLAVLLETDRDALVAPTLTVLMFVAGVGPARARRVLRDTGIEQHTRTRRLTDRQAAALTRSLRFHASRHGGWCIACGRKAENAVCKPCTDDRRRAQILADIRAWHDRHGEPPRLSDWRERRDASCQRTGRVWPTEQQIRGVFGSWNNAIAAAGYQPRPQFNRRAAA